MCIIKREIGSKVLADYHHQHLHHHDHHHRHDHHHDHHDDEDDDQGHWHFTIIWMDTGLAKPLLRFAFSLVLITIISIVTTIIIIIIITRPRPAFGRLGLGGLSEGYTYHGYTSHASPRACGARLGQNCARIGGNMQEFQLSNLPTFSKSVWKHEK